MSRFSLADMLGRLGARHLVLAAVAYCGVGFVQLPCFAARAQWTDKLVDEITNFDADITVHKNGIVTVRETIEVRSYVEIRHGIIRRIPTRSWDETWPRFTPVTFRSVFRDGRPEFYAIRDNSGELRIRIGTSRHVVGSGMHRYEIVYEIDNVVQSLGNVDQFIWNATGTYWPFNIRQVTVRVHVEGHPTILRYGTRVGRSSKGEPVVPWQQSEGHTHLVASSDQTLHPGTGFHMGLQWPAGVVHTRSWWRRLLAYSSENYITSTRLAALLLFALFAFVTYARRWLQPKNRKQPLEPPANLGPVELRYIVRRTCDPKCLAVAVASMQSKGAVTMESPHEGAYVLRLRNASVSLTPAERTVFKGLFDDQKTEVSLDEQTAEALYWTQSFCRQRLQEQFPWAEKGLRLPIWAWVFSVAIVFSSFVAGDDKNAGAVFFGMIFSVLCSLGAYSFWGYGAPYRARIDNAKVVVWGTLGLATGTIWSAAPILIFFWLDWASAVVWLGAYTLFGWSYCTLRRDPPLVEKIRNEARAFAMHFEKSLGATSLNHSHPEGGARSLGARMQRWPYALALDLEDAWRPVDRSGELPFARVTGPAEAFSGAMTTHGAVIGAQFAQAVVSLYQQQQDLRTSYRGSGRSSDWSSSSDSSNTSSGWDWGGSDWGGSDSGGDGGDGGDGGGGGDGW